MKIRRKMRVTLLSLALMTIVIYPYVFTPIIQEPLYSVLSFVAVVITIYQFIVPQIKEEQVKVKDLKLEDGILFGVPELPANFVSKSIDVDNVISQLLSQESQKIGITGSSYNNKNPRAIGLHGEGGIGKTVLAAAIARDNRIRRFFTDGIYWIMIGQNPNTIIAQQDLVRSLGNAERSVITLQDGRLCLSKILSNRKCLLILDDVWKVEHAWAFDVLGAKGKMLITTRNREVLRGLGAREHSLDVLNDKDALMLLANWANLDSSRLSDEAKEVADECGNLPLALAMIGAMIEGVPDGWMMALKKLKEADLEMIAHDFPGYAYPNLLRAISVSVDAITPLAKKCYLDLAVFPDDTLIPYQTIQMLWKCKGIMEIDSLDILRLLEDRSLIRLDNNGRVSLHDLQYDYIKKYAPNINSLHNILLDEYYHRSNQCWYSGPDDGYYFEHLAYHLKLAGRKDELHKLLMDPLWINNKLLSTKISSLLADYYYADNDFDIGSIESAIRLSGHVISKDPRQLASQLYGRLLSNRSTSIQEFLIAAKTNTKGPWLHPTNQSLIPAGSSLIATLEGHSGPITSVAISSNGNYALSGSEDNTARYWDLKNGEELKCLKKNRCGSISAVAISSDGTHALTGYTDGTATYWNSKIGAELKSININYRSNFVNRLLNIIWWGIQSISIIKFDHDARLAAIGCQSSSIKIWNLESGDLAKKRANLNVNAIAPNKNLALYLRRRYIVVDNYESESERFVEWTKIGDLPESKILQATVSSDGKLALFGEEDSTIGLLDLDELRELKILRGHDDAVCAVDLTPDGRFGLSGSRDTTVCLWDLNSGKTLKRMYGHGKSVNAVAISPSGNVGISGSDDMTIKLWDLKNYKNLEDQKNEGIRIHAVDFSITSDGDLAIFASNNFLSVVDIKQGNELNRVSIHNDEILDIDITPDGRRVVTASKDFTVGIWDRDAGRVNNLEGHMGFVYTLAITPDGRFAISGSRDNKIILWDLKNYKDIKIIKGHRDEIYSIAITPNGQFAVSGSRDKTIRFWDLTSGRELKRLIGHTESVTSIALSEDGRFVVSGSADMTIRIWDLEKGLEVKKLIGHSDTITSILITHKCKRIISSSRDKTVRIWDIDAGSVIAIFSGDDEIYAIDISRDDSKIFAGDRSGTIHILELENDNLM